MRQHLGHLTLRLAVLLITACLAAEVDSGTPGLIVESVSVGAPADKSGVKVGDRILAYNEKTLSSPAAFDGAQQNTWGKKDILLRVGRGKETLSLTVPAGALDVQVRPELSSAVSDLYESGRAAQTAGQSQEAAAKWEAAAQLAKQADSNGVAAWLYEKAAGVKEKEREWKGAIEDHLITADLLKDGTDAAARSRLLAALGGCYDRLNDFAAAERWLKEAQQVDAAAGNEMWVAADLSRIGNLHYFRGDLSAAQDYYQQSLAIRERLAPDSLAMASSLNDMGNIADDRGELELCRSYHLRALAIRERLAPDSLALAGSFNNLGIVLMELGEFQEAEKYYQRGLQIKERLLPGSPEVANTLNNLGNVTMHRGDLKGSQDYHSRALAIRSRLVPDSLDVAASFSNLADIAWRRGDLETARDYNTRALAIRERLAPNSILLTHSLSHLGLIAAQEEDFPLAVKYQTRSLQIQEQLAPNSMTVASDLINLGEIEFARNDLQAAKEYQRRALKIQEQVAPDAIEVSYSLSALGKIALAQRDFRSAHEYQTRALAIRERLAPDSLEIAETLSELGEVAFAEGLLPEAQSLFTRSVAVVESQRSQIPSAEARAFLVARHLEPYAALVRTQVALNDLPAAFATSERAHARSLLDLLKEAHTDIRQGINASLLQQERSMQQMLNDKANQQIQLLSRKHTDEEVASSRREIDEINSRYNQVSAEIRSSSPRYAALTQPQPLSLKEIQQQVLDPDTVLLEYSVGDGASYLFLVTRNSIKSYELPKRTELEVAARQVYESLVARNQHKSSETPEQRNARIARADAEYPRAASRLSQMLLSPAVAEIGGKRLLVVADGALLQIPFSALPDPKGSLEPLIVAHEVISLPSASVFVVQRSETSRRKPSRRRLALFADPVFEQDDPRVKEIAFKQEPVGKPPATASKTLVADSSTGFRSADTPEATERAAGEAGILDGRLKIRRLPFSRTEADAIMSFAPRGSSFRALGFDASRNVLASADLGEYRIVHFATHALVNNDHPELSGIVLSLVNRRGEKIDGFLRLNEIYNLNLPADLVVLSACQTALGKEIKGEGLIGLTRGFMYAGAARVVASLWKVDDEATADLMGRFYEKMLKQGQPSAAALRHAQVEMSRQHRWRNPYFWAGFSMNGEWK
jgi:CHAT domain-containing protein/Tfp pilus assembly protein PilF